ncbi:hypothetical protein BD309DRAFT_954744 [Dichomitus squalens]|nr:hypothetical protein BD309DRAFT_954744 [Dichomitus squalens]
MPGQKRRLSHDSPPKRTKRLATAPTALNDEDEDSLEAILALIKAHEESEALARKLQDEWNGGSIDMDTSGPSSSCPRSSSSRDPNSSTERSPLSPDHADVIDASDGDSCHDERVPVPEDDESMARCLAREWEIEDSVRINDLPRPPPTSASSVRRIKHKAKRVRVNSPEGSQCDLTTIDDKDDATITNEKLPAVAQLEQCRDFFTGEKTCSSCRSTLPSPRGHVTFSQHIMAPPSLLRLLHASCKSCKITHCRGCMAPLSCAPTCKGDSSECAVQTCCTNVRVLALFEALGGFDRLYLVERETSDQRAREIAARAKKAQMGSVGPGGTGYGTDPSYGHQYPHIATAKRVRRGGRSPAASMSSGEPALALVQSFDEIIVRALNTITGFLPAPYAEDPQIYDLLPHQAVGGLLALSQLPDLLGDLLRNDSVTDWITRVDVYHAMLRLLRRMADCELTLEVLVGERWEMSKSCGLEDWMWDEDSIVWERNTDTGAYVRAPPLYVHFKKLTRQCEAFLAGASSMLESAGAEEDSDVAETAVTATSLCGDIIAARDDIERAMAVMGKNPPSALHGLEPSEVPSASEAPSGPSYSSSSKRQAGTSKDKGKARDSSIDLERKYAAECERLAFKYVALSEGAYNYAPELQKTANATRNPKDRLHLVKELAVMATSLPPGVWVRVDEVRNDAIKVMIAGPAGTPYAGGLFEFDCFIPLEYPHKPPLMHLRTTGGGSVRFNPNLYNSGKVCLSLLGTWPGRPEEQWSPKSTLLQVLVSIQSMILIDLPYFNEPGFGKANPSNQASIEYNKNICMHTTRWAIVDWVKDEHKHGIWAEVIASHFSTRYDTIKKCIQEWAKTQPNIRKYLTYTGGNLYGGALAYSPIIMPPSLLHADPEISALGGVAPPYPDASSSHGSTASLLSSHANRDGRGKQPALSTSKPMDLLEEFDTGVKRVQKWKFGEAESTDLD